MEAMSRLENFCRRHSRRGRWWIGTRPEGREGQLPRLIAAQLGYPTARDWSGKSGLVRLTHRQAAHVLAVAATTSLAYGPPIPKEARRKEAMDALRDLAGDAIFFGNGLWEADFVAFTPISAATFDCGLLGYDSTHAFIYWVEEED